MKHYVYTLAYPDNMGGRVFYVGKGTGHRIYQHEEEARGKRTIRNPYKVNVIRKIWAAGGKVFKKKIASFETHKEAIEYEIALIFFMDELTNLTPGGEGTIGDNFRTGKQHTEETKRKMSLSQKARIGSGMTGKKHSQSTKEKMSASARGKSKSLVHIANLAEAHKGKTSNFKGKTHTEETKARISQSKRGKPGTNKGRTFSPEARENMRLAHLGKTRKTAP